jgi:hypothetical protein
MEQYADIYVQRKKELFPLMEQFYGPLPVNATHMQLVAIYIGLLKLPEFANQVDLLLSKYNNAEGEAVPVDPVSAIAVAVGKISEMFSGRVRTAKINAEAESDAAFMSLAMAKQGNDNTGKILIFSGIAVVVVGAIITVIILKRKK